VVNGIMRAALLWAPLIRRRVAVIVPHERHRTILSRLEILPDVRRAFDWLRWDGRQIQPLFENPSASIEGFALPETHVHELHELPVLDEVERIRALAPDILQAVPHIAGRAISIRFRGLEVARVSASGTTYPLGQPLETVIQDLASLRRYGSRHPLARAYEERWLESNLLGRIHEVLPAVDTRCIYPQVPSFVGEERNIIDLLTVTESGRLMVIEVKATADPDLPFQALDYWIAVEKHRKQHDFETKGYFRGRTLRHEPPMLVLVAPLLAFHRTFQRLIRFFPKSVSVMQIGINQAWKKDLKVLRRI
jgi:hypothetical protein